MMEFDQSYTNNGAHIDWNFPSPTATPTTASFGHQVFHTPKPTPPSHFQDAFTTPQMAAFQTPQPIHYPSMTPVQRPQTAGEEIGSHQYTTQAQWAQPYIGQPMPPPGLSNPGFTLSSSPYPNFQQSVMPLAMQGHFNSTQMQTPPPTRGQTAKRMAQPSLVAFGTPSTIASRRFITPQQPTVPSNAPQPQTTPVQFPLLHFSPDMYQFANLGPASAPVLPQGRSYWDQSTSPLQPPTTGILDDPFAPQSTQWSNPVDRSSSVQAVNFTTPAMNSFPVMEAHDLPSSAAVLPSSSDPASIQSVPGSVDPSLLYSSPIRPIIRSNGRANKKKPLSGTGDSKRKDSASFSSLRAEPVLSPAIGSGTAGPSLKRSNTVCASRPQSSRLSPKTHASISRSNSFQEPPRTTSPLKRSGRFPGPTLSESKLKPRASVILTVDENGRARTETTRLEDTPTRSIRERYPGLFDSDSSDEESDSTEKTPSRAASFTFEKGDERKAKAARLDSPVEELTGLDIPRSASSASMRRNLAPSKAAVAAAAQLRRQGSFRRPATARNTQRNLPLNFTSPLVDTSPVEAPSLEQPQPSYSVTTPEQTLSSSIQTWTPSFDESNAFAAPSIQSFDLETELEEHNRRWSVMSLEQQQLHPNNVSPQIFQHPSFPQHPTVFAPSPAALPRQIRCPCGDPADRGLPLIQCHSCTQWLHAPCIGFDGHLMPPGFICFLCTKPPPRNHIVGSRS